MMLEQHGSLHAGGRRCMQGDPHFCALPPELLGRSLILGRWVGQRGPWCWGAQELRIRLS